ncbi:MAG: 1-hydroxycarotenoid 3,4-desaturase CrtD [Pseudomonadota bacterium]
MDSTLNKRGTIAVIGAGMGGLASAIRLAAAGQDVTLFEAAATPGGKMRALPSAAGPVDAGPTVLTLSHVFDELFASAGERIEDHVTLMREDILARHWWPDGSTLDLHADAEASIEAVRAFAGDAASAEFAAFAATTRRLFEAFDAPMMQAARPRLAGLTAHVMRNPALIPAMAPHLTLAQNLAKRFTDPRLRQLFGRYATYVGGSPYRSPALLGLIWHAEAQGVWRVEGGMRALATALAGLAQQKGATIHYDTAVERIETSGDRVTGLVTAHGHHPADRIVFNGDPAALRRGLLGEGPRRAVGAKATAPRSLSAYVWSFAATPSGRDLTHHNVFFGQEPRSEFDDLAAGRMPADPTLYVCAEDRGTGTAPPAQERFEIIMNGAPTSTALPQTDEASACQTLTFKALARSGLDFAPIPATSALTTPAMFANLFPGSDGSLYGRNPQGMMAAFHRPPARTAIRGLYLAGGGAHPGAGVPMAALSGRHAAEAIFTDLASTSPSRRMDTHGGISTGSPTIRAAPYPSSGS